VCCCCALLLCLLLFVCVLCVVSCVGVCVCCLLLLCLCVLFGVVVGVDVVDDILCSMYVIVLVHAPTTHPYTVVSLARGKRCLSEYATAQQHTRPTKRVLCLTHHDRPVSKCTKRSNKNDIPAPGGLLAQGIPWSQHRRPNTAPWSLTVTTVPKFILRNLLRGLRCLDIGFRRAGRPPNAVVSSV